MMSKVFIALAFAALSVPAAAADVSAMRTPFEGSSVAVPGCISAVASLLLLQGQGGLATSPSQPPFDPVCGGALGNMCAPRGLVCVDGGTTTARCVAKDTTITAGTTTGNATGTTTGNATGNNGTVVPVCNNTGDAAVKQIVHGMGDNCVAKITKAIGAGSVAKDDALKCLRRAAFNGANLPECSLAGVDWTYDFWASATKDVPMCKPAEAMPIIMTVPPYCQGALMAAFTQGAKFDYEALCNCALKIKGYATTKYPKCKTGPTPGAAILEELPQVCARLKDTTPCMFDEEDCSGKSRYLKDYFHYFANTTGRTNPKQAGTYLGNSKKCGCGNTVCKAPEAGAETASEADKAKACAEAATKAKAKAKAKAAEAKAADAAKAKTALKGKGGETGKLAKEAKELLKSKGCKGTVGGGEAGEAGEAGRARRANGTALGVAVANMDCAQLKAEFKKQGDVAKAMYAKLKAAKSACGSAVAKPAANTTGRARRAADDYVGFTCEEIEAEIKLLKTEAAAAGLVLEPIGGGEAGEAGEAGTTVDPDSGAAGVAGGVAAFVAVAFAQLA